MTNVSAKELANHTGAVLERVRKGERIRVSHRGRIVADLVPVVESIAAREEVALRLAAIRRLEGSIRHHLGRGVEELLSRKREEKAREEQRWNG